MLMKDVIKLFLTPSYSDYDDDIIICWCIITLLHVDHNSKG